MSSIPDVSDRSIVQLVSLSGRAAVVTGGAQGLGKSIAGRLAEAGADVLIGDVNIDVARAAAAQLDASYPGKIIATHMDVSDAPSVADAARLSTAELGGIDVWVNNAGIFPSVPVAEMSEEQWDQVFAINARGTFLGSREAIRTMQAQGRAGVIINVASLAGLNGIAPGLAAYVGSKHAVVGITRQMARELAPQRIRVLGVAPSFMATEGNLAVMQMDPGLAQRVTSDIPSMFSSKLGRVGVPDDVARAVLFCASDMAIFMSGTTLVVDAGETA